jgi:DNA-binding MarR family transcriptional regulator
MLTDALNKVYRGLRMHFYMQVMPRFDAREATLTTVEAFSMEVIYTMHEPTISEFSEMLGISSPNAAVRINSLIRKGYLDKVQSNEDKRTFHLHPTQKFYEYNRISDNYLETIVERCEKRFSREEIETLEKMLNVIDQELMPEIKLDDHLKRQRSTS